MADPNTTRVDWSLGYPAMLIEPSATNLIARSDFSSGWGNGHIYDTSTFKGQPSVKFKRTSGTYSYFQWNSPISNTSGTTYTFQLWLRTLDGSTRSTQILHYSATNGDHQTRKVTPEWQLFSVQFIGDGDAIFVGLRTLPTDVPFEMAMPQVEEGSVATSYIPTSGSAVTRNADNLVIDGTAFSDFYNATEGTFYVESAAVRDDNIAFLFDVNNGDTQRNLLYYPDFNNLKVLIRKDNTTSATLTIGSRPSVGILSRAAFGYATDNLKGSLNGGTVAVDTSVIPPTTVNEMTIGSHVTLNDLYHLNGHIKRLIYWPTHSDNL